MSREPLTVEALNVRDANSWRPRHEIASIWFDPGDAFMVTAQGRLAHLLRFGHIIIRERGTRLDSEQTTGHAWCGVMARLDSTEDGLRVSKRATVLTTDEVAFACKTCLTKAEPHRPLPRVLPETGCEAWHGTRFRPEGAKR